MKINELFSDILNENISYEFKSILNQDNPLKWAKTIVAYANGEGGFIFVGVADNREIFGLDLETIDKTKKLVSLVFLRMLLIRLLMQIKYLEMEIQNHRVLGLSLSNIDPI